MECPHCRVQTLADWVQPQPQLLRGTDNAGHDYVHVRWTTCRNPQCGKPIVELGPQGRDFPGPQWRLAFPFDAAARRLPPEVTDAEVRRVYPQAAAVLIASPDASAALSRRLLQHLLKEAGHQTGDDLSKLIDQFMADPASPKALSGNLDYLREIGNFGTHPMKSTNTGEVMPVEPGEAEWCLDVLDSLLEFYFVQPARDAARRAAFDQRLGEAGRRSPP